MVDLSEDGVVVKITIPPGFGLTPAVVSHPVINLRNEPSFPAERQTIEFLPATPLEYLERWIASNEIFEDNVRIASVVHWSDGKVSFSILQPQYHGEPATDREIESFFNASGWTRIRDRSGHIIFFNYAFQTLAIDALPRNCYINDGSLLPFDVILCRPNDPLEKFLCLYPD